MVAIPKHLARELGMETGEKVLVEKMGRGIFITKAKKSKIKEVTLDVEFKKWWRAFLKDNVEILDKLAVR